MCMETTEIMMTHVRWHRHISPPVIMSMKKERFTVPPRSTHAAKTEWETKHTISSKQKQNGNCLPTLNKRVVVNDNGYQCVGMNK